MTEPADLKPNLGRFGVWTFGAVTPEQAKEIEKLGYGAVWVGGSPSGDLSFAEPILEATETLQLATGIVNVWTAPADQVAESYHRIEKAPSRPFPARHRHRAPGAHRGVPQAVRRARRVSGRPRRGQRPDQPSRGRGAGPEGAQAVGEAQRWRAPVPDDARAHRPGTPTGRQHACIWRPSTRWCWPGTRPRPARSAARRSTSTSDLSNYVNNWKRLGFTDADVAEARQRQAHRRGGGPRHPRRHRQAPAGAHRRGRRPRLRFRCSAARTR